MNDAYRVLVLDMQPIDPPVGGGRVRLLGLYHNLGDNIATTYIGTYDWPGEKYRDHHLTDTLREITVPLSTRHFEECSKIQSQVNGKTVIDVTFHQLAQYSEDYVNKIMEFLPSSHVVIISHPWIYPIVKDKIAKDRQVLIYDSHNVEGYLRFTLLDDGGGYGTEIVKEVVRVEYDLCHDSDVILACSYEDRQMFNKLYDVCFKKIKIFPNGVFADQILPVSKEQKFNIKQQLGLGEKFTAIFIGSHYAPNIEAANFICNRLAPEFKDVTFVIAGGVGGAIDQEIVEKYSNIHITGFLDEDKKIEYLSAADMAINPMFSGSGTNIKMFDFMAAGLPIITTQIGARGIADHSTVGIWIASQQNFAAGLHELKSSLDISLLGCKNRKWVEQDFSWEIISPRLGEMLLNFQRPKLLSQNRHSIILKSTHQSLRIAHISSAGHRCGIGEYTLRLLQHLPKESFTHYVFTCVTPTNQPTFADNELHTDVGWYYDDQTWQYSHFKSDLVTRITSWCADTVLIQYHPGFYSGNVLETFVNALLKYGIQVAIIIHNFSSCDRDVLVRLSKSGVCLISHGHKEIDQAETHGIELVFLPLGVDKASSHVFKTIQNRCWSEQPPIIATTGFLRHHKGIQNLILAIPLLQPAFPGATLMAQCALFPSEDSREELRLCEEIIKTFRVDKSILLDTEFLPIETVYRRISKADVAVLPYKESDEGGSATAATCISAGLPLIVSDVPIFDELKNVTCRLEDIEPETIAKTLIEIFDSPDRYAQLYEAGSTYLEENSWENVSKRLSDILLSYQNNSYNTV